MREKTQWQACTDRKVLAKPRSPYRKEMIRVGCARLGVSSVLPGNDVIYLCVSGVRMKGNMWPTVPRVECAERILMQKGLEPIVSSGGALGHSAAYHGCLSPKGGVEITADGKAVPTGYTL